MIRRQLRSVVNQRGIASIIVVFIITVIISLVSLGFARLMDRALQNVSNNQLGAAADYAAQSGLNDAIAYLKSNQGALATPVTECGTLLAPGRPLADKANLTTDQNTKYTCVLINSQPGDLAYQNLQPYQSQVVKLLPSNGRLGSLMFSWRASTNPTSKSPFASGEQLLTESAWNAGSGRPPMIRVTLYPITDDSTPLSSNPTFKTFYLYPNNVDGTIGYVSSSGEIVGGNCDFGGPFVVPFNDNDYQCNVVVGGLADAAYYEARITPLYVAADVDIQGADRGAPQTLVNFKDAQTVIDVTGKSANAVRRIQARVAVGSESIINSGSNAIPEDAIRSASTICKRLIVPTTPVDTVFVDPGSVANNSTACGLNGAINPPPAPDVTLNVREPSVTAGQTVTIDWTINSFGVALQNCTTTSNPAVTNWNSSNFSQTTGSRSGVGPLNTPPTQSFILTCTNIYGGSDTATDTVTVNLPPPPPPPAVSLTADPVAVAVGGTTTLTWTVTNSPTSCTASNDGSIANWTGSKTTTNSSQSGVGPLNTARVYNFTLTCSNSSGTGSDTASVTASSNPIPPPPPGGGSCPNGQNGSGTPGIPDPCVRSVVVGWDSSGTYAYVNAYVDHCYGGITVNYPGGSFSKPWPGGSPPGGDNIFVSYNMPPDGPIPTGSGTVTVTCYGVSNNSQGSASLGARPGGGGPGPGPGPGPSTCSDSIDNDGDAFNGNWVDGGDPDCGDGNEDRNDDFIVFWDCHPSGGIYWIYEHHANGAHINTNTGLPGMCAV